MVSILEALERYPVLHSAAKLMTRDFERLCETVESFIYVTMIRLIVNRLAPA